MTKVNYLKFINYFTNQYHLQEIFLIASAITISYSSNNITSESNFNLLFSSLSIVTIFYGSICAFIFGQRIEKGLYGYIFSMPIRRKTFFMLSAFLEFFILPSLIIIILLFVSEIKFFYISYKLLMFGWFVSISILAFIISIGRIFGSITKNGIAAFVLTYGSIEIISQLNNSKNTDLSNNPILNFIINGFSSEISASTALISLAVLIFSLFMVFVSSKILLNSNLKNGR